MHLATLFGMIGLMLATTVSCASRQGSWSRPNTLQCLNNLQRIDSSIHALGLEGRYKKGDYIPEDKIAAVLQRDGVRIPVCPEGGYYLLPPVGGYPRCSFHGDLLKKEGKL